MEATREQGIERAVARYHLEQQGHTPQDCRVVMLSDMAIVRCTGIFTATEQQLVATEEGRKLVQSARREQRALGRRQVEAMVSAAAGREVVRSFYDLDVRVGEQAEIYVFE